VADNTNDLDSPTSPTEDEASDKPSEWDKSVDAVKDKAESTEGQQQTFDEFMGGCINSMTGGSLWVIGIVYLIYARKGRYTLLYVIGASLIAISYCIESTFGMWALAGLVMATPFLPRRRR